MSMLQNMLWATPPSTLTTDVRTPSQSATDSQRYGVANSLIDQYGRWGPSVSSAYSDSGYGVPGGSALIKAMLADYAGARGSGMPSYLEQLDQQQTIMNSALSRASASGSQGSGYANQQMARGVVDYQEGLAKTLADYRTNLLQRILQAGSLQDSARSDLARTASVPLSAGVSLYGQGSQPYAINGIPGKQDMLSSIVGSVMGGGGGSGGMNVGGLMGGGGGGAAALAV